MYTLTNYLAKDIGTSGSTVVALGTNNTAELDSLFVCNTTVGSVNATVTVDYDSVNYHLIKDLSVPPGSSLEIINGSKLFLKKGATITVSSSVDTSLDVVASAKVNF